MPNNNDEDLLSTLSANARVEAVPAVSITSASPPLILNSASSGTSFQTVRFTPGELSLEKPKLLRKKSFTTFARKHNIIDKWVYADHNYEDPALNKPTNTHFECTLKRNEQYKMTFGLTKLGINAPPPDINEMLKAVKENCLSVMSYSNNSEGFVAWAIDYNQNSDSRAAEALFKIKHAKLNRTKKLFGEIFDKFIYETK